MQWLRKINLEQIDQPLRVGNSVKILPENLVIICINFLIKGKNT